MSCGRFDGLTHVVDAAEVGRFGETDDVQGCRTPVCPNKHQNTLHAVAEDIALGVLAQGRG
jgi:hypothetical protein